MKKFLIILIAFISVQNIANAQSKKARQGYTPGLNPAINNCNCNNLKVNSNVWIEGSNTTNFTNYILEVQISPVSAGTVTGAAACTPVLDSLYFFTVARGLAADRYNAVTEFVKTVDKISTDNKWRTIRYRIPKSVFNRPLVLNQPLSMFYVIRYGNTKCKPSVNLKITDELL